MRWVGEGRHLWSVRVDLVAPDDDGGRVGPAFEQLVGRKLYDVVVVPESAFVIPMPD
jgi:hypothetical protein